MCKTLSVTKYLTDVYKYVIFCVTLFCYTIRNMAIFFNFLKHGLDFKNKFFFLAISYDFSKKNRMEQNGLEDQKVEKIEWNGMGWDEWNDIPKWGLKILYRDLQSRKKWLKK